MEKNLDLGMQYMGHLQQKIFHKLFIRQVYVNIISWIGRPIPNNVSTYSRIGYTGREKLMVLF